MAAQQPRARSRLGQAAGSSHSATGAGLPDFETLLASKGSTIRVRASEDRRSGGGDSENEELGDATPASSPPPTPPRKSPPIAMMQDRKGNGVDAYGSAGGVRGREAALRDIEREMALDEADEDHAASSEADTSAGDTALHQDGITTAADTTHAMDSAAHAEPNSQSIAGSTALPKTPSITDKALPMSPPDLIEADLRRRSQYRSPGLATSPDLATLVKTARASNGQVPTLSSQQPSYETAGTSSQVQQGTQYAPSISPVMTVRPPASPRSRVSSESGTRRHTPVVTTVSSLQAAMDLPRARAVSTRSDSGTSFVHVNSNHNIPGRVSSLSNGSNNYLAPQSTLSTIPDSEFSVVTSVSSSGSTARRSKKLTKGGGEDNSISSAMRKTSGFFRKTFGSKDHASTSSAASTSRPPSTLSVPNTPTSVRFSSYESPNKPPVPSIPSAFTQTTPTRRPSVDADSSASPQSRTHPSRSSSQATSSKPSPAKSLGRFSSFAASFRSSDNRSTSDLQNSTTSLSNHASPSRGSASGMKTSTSTVSTEQERLARELHQWQGYEQSLEMLAPQENDTQADTSMNTIRARTSTSSRGDRRPSIPSTPPQAARNRSRSNSAAGSGSVFMSGSIPSPQIGTRSPKPSNPDAFFMSGSIPSPPQAQRKFQATNGTPITETGPSISPALKAASMRFSSYNASSPNGVASLEEKSVLSPASGKQIRKRSTSASVSPVNSPILDEHGNPRTPTVRLVASPSSQEEDTPGGRSESVIPPARKGSIGLGLAMGDNQEASDLNAESQGTSDSHDLSPMRPKDIPRLVTQSPSPAPPKLASMASAYTSPTPARTTSISGGAGSADTPLDSSIANMYLSEPDTARSFADKCWNEDESFMKKEKIAEWLGGHGSINQASLTQYMQNFEFKDLSLEMAFRRLCEKLYLRAETQQIDRILAAFSARYIEENPDSIFQTKDIVHAVTYAMLLLNTDLHVADVTSRMSRSDFVFNTMSAIHAQNSATPSIGARTPASSNSPATHGTNGFFQADGVRSASSEQWRDGTVTARFRPKRSGSASANSSRTGLNEIGAFTGSSTNLPMQSPTKEGAEATDGLAISGRSDTKLSGKAWEAEVESALKEIYNAVRSKAIMQPLAYSQLAPPSATGSPYNSWNGSVNRTPSRRSQASLTNNDRSVASKRNSIRGFLGASHESLRPTSPTPSAGTSMSGGNFSGSTFGSAMSNATSYYPPTMGFASNLSHTIIKEQQEDDALSEASDESTSDEELALLGAPWAKEGILQRKHYWETPNKRSKDKHWLQVFAVISKGEMKMFQFGGSGAGSSFGGGVGGGNWLTNAHIVGEVPLAHSLSSAMPPPGYNRSRPHVLVLTLSSGGSYFFQAGTEDLVNEWVLTCNYWAGRTSREPLLGGVSNMDYGWNRVLGSVESQEDTEDLASVRSGRSGHSRRSRVSYAGSLSRQHGIESAADRATIFDWRPPQAPTGFSTLSEDAQFDALRKHTLALQMELERHNDLRGPMLKLYSPRSANAAKAAANWEKKSKYLLAELVKYQTYVEALKVARQERQKRRDEKQVNRLLEEADDNAGLGDPNYVPEMDTSLDSMASNNTSRDVQEGNALPEEGHPLQSPNAAISKTEGRHNRTSAASMSTAADFFEAHDGRVSPEM